MSAKNNIERLFLLEILVDNVYIATSDLDLNPKTLSNLKQTCVKFQFLNFPPLEICEEDFAPSKGQYDTDEVNFKSGKSCLFALKGQHPSAFSPPFDIDVTVCRMMANKRSCTIGQTCIKLGDCFATIVNCCIVCPESPTSKTMKDTYPLVDERNCKIGTISVYIRLSCFGKFIITQFQLGGLENKSFLFRAENDNKKEETSPVTNEIVPTQYKEGNISKAETFCESVKPSLSSKPCPPRPYPGPSGFPNAPPFMGMGMPNMMPPPGMGGMMPPPGMGGMMPPPGMGGMMPPPYMGGMMPMPNMNMIPGFSGGQSMQLMPLTNFENNMNSPDSKGASGDYKELIASVNGHELCIRILRKPKKPKETRIISTPGSYEQLNKDGVDNFCDCDVELPKGVLDSSRKGKTKPNEVEVKGPCPYLSEGPKAKGYNLPKGASSSNVSYQARNNVSVKENFILKLGDRPPVCYKMPPPHPIPPFPCITDRDSQFEQGDMYMAMKLQGAAGPKGGEKAAGKKSGKGGKGGKGKGGKGGKGKGKGKK